MENVSVFDRACLIQLSTSVWQGTRMIEQNLMRRVNDNSDWLRGRKYLIDPELLAPVRLVAGRARKLVQKHALPFPIQSVYLIPKESLDAIDGQLNILKANFRAEVLGFENRYAEARRQAQEMLGELFDESDYPVDILGRFRFSWRFLSMEVPGRSTLLSPEIYEREKRKFQDMMAETRDLARSALREEFARVVESLARRLSADGDRPRMLTPKMYERMQEFLDGLDARNIFEDERLRDLTVQARQLIGNAASGGLGSNDFIRRRVKQEMARLQSAVEEAVEELPRRRIRLAV
jgi:hypothetical protein